MKICSKCKIEKPVTLFNLKYGKPTSQCKECHKKYTDDHYKKNKEEYYRKARVNSAKYRDVIRDTILNHFNTHPCVDCGISDVRVLEFDHVKGDKAFNMAHAFDKRVESVVQEIEKCEVRCANCHRIITAERASSWRANLPS